VDIRSEFTDLLSEIEDEMRSVLAEHDGHTRPLYEMLAYHLGLDRPEMPRGKRIRPLLGLLAYQALTGEHEAALPGAAAVELGHNFSLVHDDIEDADRERRYRPTLWALWGVETCLALCEGQFLDISFESRTDVTVDEYLEMISRKTAALLGASVQAGAILATDDPEAIEAFRSFGYELGMAFQMADDVKGSFWSSSASGKPEAGDVRRRKVTLPLVWALEHAAEADAERLRRIYAQPNRAGAAAPPGTEGAMSDAEVSEVLAILERSGAREHALAETSRYRERAAKAVDRLPIPAERRRELVELVETTIAV